MPFQGSLVTLDPVQSDGPLVFGVTRVPVKALHDHLRAGEPLDLFPWEFPDVSLEHAQAVLANVFAPFEHMSLIPALESLWGHVKQMVDVDIVSANVLCERLEDAAKQQAGHALVSKTLLYAISSVIRALESERPGMRAKDHEVGELIKRYQKAYNAMLFGH